MGKPGYKKAYDAGVPLPFAALHFAPKELSDKRAKLQKASEEKAEAQCRLAAATMRRPDVHESTKQSLARTFEIDLKRLETDSNYLKPSPEDAALVAHDIDFKAVEHGIAEAFWRQMHDGTLTAIGYVAPRKLEDPPVIVSEEIIKSCSRFTRFFGNDFDEIMAAGLHFLAVRIARTDSLQKFETRGRRSRRQEIISSFKKLKARKKISTGAPWKFAQGQIRDDLVKTPEDDWGLEIDAVMRALKGLHHPKRSVQKAKSKKN